MTSSLPLSFPPLPPLPASRWWNHRLSLAHSQLAFSTPFSLSKSCRRRASLTLMSSDSRRSTSLASQSELRELHDDSDFETLLSPDGYISICGFGSLLSERSARSTFPDLVNFRVARLNGFRRVFAHVAPIFFERGIAKPETKEISSLSVESCAGETLIVTVFEIRKSEIPAFMKRELEFRFLAVLPETLDEKPFDNLAVLCTCYSDVDFLNIRCGGRKEIYFQHYGRWNIDKIWRDDVLPCRIYLRHCVLAGKSLGDATYNNFLDHTYLADRKSHSGVPGNNRFWHHGRGSARIPQIPLWWLMIEDDNLVLFGYIKFV